MDASSQFIRDYFGDNLPLSETEIDQLATALYRLAMDGISVPKSLLRHSYTGDLGTSRSYGHTLDAIPAALDRLAADREAVVVGLLRRFDQAVQEHYDQVANRKPGVPLDGNIMQRYFDVAPLLPAAKPKTEESVKQIANFLQLDKSDVHEKASAMLEGAPYFPVIIDRLIENVAVYGIRQFPNRQSRALASFAYIPEVRGRVFDCFNSQDKNLRYLAVMTFSFLREGAGTDVEEELFAIAKNDADLLQGEALAALKVITSRDARLRALALRLTNSDKYWVRGNAIACLETFADRESIDALVARLLDEGGHDFDNAGHAAKLLLDLPLDPGHVLEPLTHVFSKLLEKEDQLYQEQAGYREGIQALANAFKNGAEQRGEPTEGLGTISYASPEVLLGVARIFGRLGAAARPAIPLLRACAERPYVSGATDSEEWQRILKSIEG